LTEGTFILTVNPSADQSRKKGIRMQFCRMAATLFLLASLSLSSLSTPATASDIGVVVLHGKQGGAGDRPTIAFVRALIGAGYAIQAPVMCWASTRIYDAPLPECLKGVDAAVAALRAGGARRIVVAGQSLGGEAAFLYATTHPDLAGVIAFAPAGQPEGMNRNPLVAQSVAEAKQMVAAGQGDQRHSFTDTNNGQNFTAVTTPAIFLSFMELGGPADFPLKLSEVHVPVIWVAGSMDHSQDAAPTLFARLPANPLNKFVQVTATHLDTPNAGTDAALDWLKTLPGK
jgi:pimeloyl-ACP methyl ester carboxylesterase